MNDKKRPANLGANEVPSDGYVLSIDGMLKARYETLAEAMTAGSKLKQQYPVVHVAVFDATTRKYTPVN